MSFRGFGECVRSDKVCAGEPLVDEDSNSHARVRLRGEGIGGPVAPFPAPRTIPVLNGENRL